MDIDQRWVPDHEDGSGWAPVDWGSVIRGTKYHYRHVQFDELDQSLPPQTYRVVTRLQSPEMPLHENTYFVSQDKLADFLAELSLAGGVELIWHVEPCAEPPVEAAAS